MSNFWHFLSDLVKYAQSDAFPPLLSKTSALPSLTKVSTKYKQRTMLSTLSSTLLSSTSRDTGEATASCVGDAGVSPSFLGVLSAPLRDPLRERRRRKDLRILSLRDFFLDRCSPLSVS